MPETNHSALRFSYWLRDTFISPFVRWSGYIIGFVSVFVAGGATLRALTQASNITLPNELPDLASILEMFRRENIDEGNAASIMLRLGYDSQTAASLLALTKNLFTIPDLLNLRYKKVISDALYVSLAGQIGVTPEQAADYLKAFEQRLDILTVMSAWRRGFFNIGDPVDYFDDLRAQGWTDDRIEMMKKTTSFIPPPTDVIRFLMRDVFIPEFVTTYGMDQEYPADADAYFAKLGIDHATALLYWEAHWELPSISQAYEMYQRGKINEADLRRLLRAQGVEPYWRDPLIAISYNPITRVDIRRLHAYGTITDDDLPGLYQQIGYSPDNAKQLAAFTITYNAAHPVANTIAAAKIPAQYHGMSESSIVNAYEDGLITHDDAITHLGEINIQAPIANLLLSLADYKAHQQELKDEIEIVKDSYLQGQASLNDTMTALGQLGLTAAQQAHAVAQVQRARRKMSALPTKAELTKFYTAKVISDREYVTELRNIGYSDKYIGWYLQEAGMTEQAAAETITNTDAFGTLPQYGTPAQPQS